MSAQLAQALQQDAEHWKKLGDQAARDGESAAADAYRVCADQLCEALAAHEAAPQQEPAITVTIDDLDLVQDWAESRLPPGTHKLYAAPQQAQAPTQAEVDLNEALLEVDYWKRIAAHLAAPVGYKLVPIREVQQAQAPGWQDIATAPNDGSLLLLFERYEYEPFIGSWQYGKWTASRTHYDTDGNACVTDRVYSDGVSHWMPLPAAPQQGSNT